MKKSFLVLMATLLFISSCELFSPNPSNITEVQEYRASDLADSGATDYPTSEEEIALAFNEIREDDPVLADIVDAFSEEEEKSAFSKKALDVAKSLNDSLKTQLEEIIASIEAFPTTKELDEDISLSGEALGTYFILTKGEGTLSATAETDDDQAIDEYASNLESLSGEATLQIQIDPTPALASAGLLCHQGFPHEAQCRRQRKHKYNNGRKWKSYSRRNYAGLRRELWIWAFSQCERQRRQNYL